MRLLCCLLLLLLSAPSVQQGGPPPPQGLPPSATVDGRLFGIVADGVTDTTAALQRAVGSLVGTSQTLLLPPGVLLVSDSLNWTKRVGAPGSKHNGEFASRLTVMGAGVGSTVIRCVSPVAGGRGEGGVGGARCRCERASLHGVLD
eukprot:COSAG04_NODE_163_length_21807_cov_8.304580_9_plen_146_part_00